MPQQLPAHPNLDHLKKQAKDVLRVFRRQNPRWKLADAQRAIARGYGFVNWPSLKIHVQKVRDEQRPRLPTLPHALKPDDSSVSKTSLTRAESRCESCSIHPIVGTWIADGVKSSPHNDPQLPNDDIVVEFQLSGEEIKLTQVATDTTGHEIAMTTTICADGQEHPVPFGEGVRLNALWTTSLVLEATFTTSDRPLSKWSYEVSPDGGSLVISAAEERLVFRRL
jgi:hypothetical protein